MNTNVVTSDSFSYKNLDCIIICDGSNLATCNNGGLGWVIIDANTSIMLAEGRAITSTSQSTTDLELFAALCSLTEAKEMNMNHIHLKIDFDGFIKHLCNNNTNLANFNKLNTKLANFDSWCVTKVDRNELSRAHDLASSIDKDLNYCLEFHNLIS